MIEYLLSPEIQTYISDHLYDDPAELMLRSPKKNSEHYHLILDQIKSKRKAKTKLPSWYAQKNVIFPPPLSMEQCSSEETASYKAGLINGKSVVDLTGGFGVDSYYISQQFDSTTYVEQNAALAKLATHNFESLGAKIDIVNTSAEEYLEKIDAVDWIYLDPARRDADSKKVFRLADCSPDVEALQGQLLAKSENVLIKLAPLLDIKQAISSLSQVRKILVLAVKNEVKELLIHLEAGYEGEAHIDCVNLKQNGVDSFGFYFSQESVEIDLSEVDQFLYEPNAAILKGGAFKSIGIEYGLQKLHANTHLYTSSKLIQGFPGRVFKVLKELPLSKKLKSDFPEMKGNIAVRNHPLSVDQIKAKTKIKDGGDHYLFAFTDMAGRQFILCEKEY